MEANFNSTRRGTNTIKHLWCIVNAFKNILVSERDKVLLAISTICAELIFNRYINRQLCMQYTYVPWFGFQRVDHLIFSRTQLTTPEIQPSIGDAPANTPLWRNTIVWRDGRYCILSKYKANSQNLTLILLLHLRRTGCQEMVR